ncbi:MAG TPA: hypothetical protein DCP71_10175 [Verrucomicrobiales bacterium]|nr:hypothetical protein [Verrucomicrobiales bacterium]
MKVFLTFDDGPQDGTGDVLDVLAEKGVKATFFITGGNAGSIIGGKDEQTKLVKRILKDKHVAANHCFSHAIQTKTQYKDAYGDLATSAQKAALRKNYNDNKDYFKAAVMPEVLSFRHARLPGDGRFITRLVEETESEPLKMIHHGWTFEFAPNGKFAWVTEKDWQGIAGVAASVKSLPNDKATILLHDRHWAGAKKAMLGKILDKLKNNGFEFALFDDAG